MERDGASDRPAEERPRAAGPRDPREIITPDAFRVAPELIGLPLATPWRRAAAMLVDLALIGVLVGLKEVSGTLFGLLLAWVLFRIASGAAGRKLSGAARAAMRIAAVVALVFSIGGFVSCILEGPWIASPEGPNAPARGGAEPDSPGLEGEAPGPEGFRFLAELGRGLGDVAALRDAASAEEALPPARRLARTLQEVGADLGEVEDVLGELLAVEGAAAWRDSVIRTALSGIRAAEADRATDADSLALLYVAALAEADTPRAERLRLELADRLSGERIEALEARNRGLQESLERAREEAEGEAGLVSFLRDLADDIGIGFGWAGLYFTIFLVLWKGQTPGKRLLRLRVARLTGERLGWWPAFERFGGYAASLATGLLGFLQILWDANRQGVHDQIVGTVVVRDSPAARRAIVKASRAAREIRATDPRKVAPREGRSGRRG